MKKKKVSDFRKHRAFNMERYLLCPNIPIYVYLLTNGHLRFLLIEYISIYKT